MSETITTENHDSLDESFKEKLKQHLDILSSTIPEIAETREVIDIGSKSLIAEFSLKPEFFDDEAHCLFFVALAQRNGNLINAIESGQTSDMIIKEKEFIYDAMALVSLEKSENYDQFASLIDSSESNTGEYERAVYEKYTNQEVTEKMQALINNGLLNEVRAHLGVTPENEDRYELRVLNIGNEYSYDEMRPRQSEGLSSDKESNYFEKSYTEYINYRDSLKHTTRSFIKEINMSREDVPLAWKQEIDGVVTLALPLPVAEMIIDPETKIKGDKNKALENIISILEHEYVHTQGGLHLDEGSLIGITLEELRAEHYSGDKQGYDECKAAANYINVATGFDLIEEMDKFEKGGSCAAMFTEISNRLGLQQALELGFSYPRNYVDSSSQLITMIDGYLDGLNGFVARLCENNRFKDRSDRRFKEYADLSRRDKSIDILIDFYENYDTTINRMPYAASKMIKLLQT